MIRSVITMKKNRKSNRPGQSKFPHSEDYILPVLFGAMRYEELPAPILHHASRSMSWKGCLSLLFGFCLFYFIIFQLAISTSTPTNHARTTSMESDSGTSRSFRDGVSQNSLVADGGPCSRLTQKVDLLVLILTDSYDSLGRNLMRSTYGGSLNKFKSLYSMTFFLVDVSNGVLDEQDLMKEMAIFNDISLFVSEFSYSGSESVNFNITQFPKTSTWVKNCVQNSVTVLYFEHLREFRLYHVLEQLSTASESSFVPSAIPNNIFIAPSHIISSFVGSKIEDWGVYIPNNLERLLLYLPNDNTKLKEFVYSREDSDTNGTITDFESKFILKWQAKNTKKMVEGTMEMPVFEKLRIQPKYAMKRPKTVEPKKCLPVKGNGEYREKRSILVFIDWEVGQAWQRNAIRKSYGLIKPFTSGNVEYDFNFRFLVTQHRYVLFKDEETKQLEAEAELFGDILGYYKMSLHDNPSFNVTSSLRLAIDWANENCSDASYVIFLSSNSFLNPYLLVDYIQKSAITPDMLLIDGSIKHTSLPVRKFNRPGFVSKVLYPELIFPPFAEFANGAILTKKTIQTLSKLPYLVRDTGINEITLGIYARCGGIELRFNPYYVSTSKDSLVPSPRNSITITQAAKNFTTFWANITRQNSVLKLEKSTVIEEQSDLLKGFNKTLKDENERPSSEKPYFGKTQKFPAIKEPTRSLCSKTNPNQVELMFATISDPKKTEMRAAIRSSWGKIKYHQGIHISNVFLLGMPSPDEEATLQDMLTEADLYNDIVIFNFIDSYRNVTLKTANGLDWCLKHCPHVDFIQKIDDDSLANIYGLTHYLSHFAPKEKLYMGFVSKKGKPIRKLEKGMPEHFKKWIITKEEYPGDNYPPYALGGPGYIMSRDVALQFVDEAWRTQFFVFEDVYVGILNTKVKINPVSHYLFNNQAVDNLRCDCHKFYASHHLNATQIVVNWYHLHTQIVKCQIRKCNA